MRIAIVDDIASERQTLRDGLDGQLSRLSLDALVWGFGSGAEFLAPKPLNVLPVTAVLHSSCRAPASPG